jgi:hypothetical protein
MTGADDPDSDTEVPICVRPEVALAYSRVRSMGEEVPHSTDSSERLSDNPLLVRNVCSLCCDVHMHLHSPAFV